MVRCGLGLYGYLPSRHGATRPSRSSRGARRCARPCRSRRGWSPCRTLDAGERPSYGRLRPLPSRSVVATVPIGYADGVPRAPVRRRLRGAHRRDAPAAGGRGDDGPDRRRLRRRRLGAAGRRGRAARPAGRRGDHGGRLGGPARDDQLRGGVRRRPADAPHRWSTGPTHPVPDADVLERLRRHRVDLHPVPAGRGADPGRLRRGRSGRRPPLRGRGTGPRGGPGRRALRRPLGQAARPPHVGGDRPRPGPSATSPTSSSAGRPTTATRRPDEIEACRPYLEPSRSRSSTRR